MVRWPAAAHGQSPELIDADKRYKDLYAQGRYEEALPFAEEALRLGEHEFGPDHPVIAALLTSVAELNYTQGRYAKAEPL